VGRRRAHSLPSSARTHAQRLASLDGYFAPDSVIRRVGNSPLVPLLGGGAAVLLQVAHPLVAAGVVSHSDYEEHLWRRLVRTLRTLYLMTYGSREEADAAGAAVQAVHGRVHGVTTRRLGPFPAGTPYSASDPELMLWVHATLVETSLAVHRRFIGTLTADEEDTYYTEMALVATLFGLPAAGMPSSLSAFRSYLDRRLRGPDICVTEPAREVAKVILEAPLAPPLWALVPAHRLSTAALLPPRIRVEYGLHWSRAHAVSLAVAGRSLGMIATPLLYVAKRVSPPELAYAA